MLTCARPLRNAVFVGRPFPGAKRNNTFDRFPLSYASVLRPDVWQLSEMSTGVYLRFATDARSATVSWKLRPVCAEKWFAGCHLFHMPDSGTSAMDTYVYDAVAKDWRHAPNSMLHYAESGTATVYRPSPPNVTASKSTTFLLYLPLRNAPAAINVTVDAPYTLCGGGAGSGCALDTAPQFAMPPIVWYGTSIQQGGVASRAGNTYDALVSRRLGREIYNVGFANNGVMELSVGALICDVVEAAAIVIDCLPNMNTEQVTNRTAPLVHYLRANGHATTPIILAEGTPTPGAWLNNTVNGYWGDAKNAALKAEYTKLVAAGVENLHYISSDELFSFHGPLTPTPEGKDVNPTVCGVHPSDLGQYQIASFYISKLPTILGQPQA